MEKRKPCFSRASRGAGGRRRRFRDAVSAGHVGDYERDRRMPDTLDTLYVNAFLNDFCQRPDAWV